MATTATPSARKPVARAAETTETTGQHVEIDQNDTDDDDLALGDDG